MNRNIPIKTNKCPSDVKNSIWIPKKVITEMCNGLLAGDIYAYN